MKKIDTLINYISDLVRREDFDPEAFNLIDAGPGTGKTTFVNERLHELFPEIEYKNMFMAESRSLTANMLDKSDSNFSMLYITDVDRIRRMTGLPELNAGSVENAITVATYDKLVEMVAHNNSTGDILAGIDLVVLDEVHCLYTDVFISNMKAVAVWLKGLFSQDRIRRPLVIGLTATPDCFLELNAKEQNLPIHRVLDRKLVKYKADHLICGLMTDIPRMCRERFRGKTIIMCERLDDCYMLARTLGNAAVVCSARNEHITSEMVRIRRYIEENAALPETYLNEDTGKWEPLRYLIMTATGREGYNFTPRDKETERLTEADIQNVVVCFTDPMSIIQFAGRPRYNVPNVMVAMNPFGQRGTNKNSVRTYTYQHRQNYLNFVYAKDRRGNPWYKLVSPFFSGGINDVEVLPSMRQPKKTQQKVLRKMRSDAMVPVFIKVINQYVSHGGSERRLYKDQEEQTVVALAREVGLFGQSEPSFRKISHLLERHGYEIDSGDERAWIDGQNVHKPYHVIRRKDTNEKGQNGA